MLKSELIKALEGLPDDALVYFREPYDDGYDIEVKGVVFGRPEVLWSYREPKEGRSESLILTA